jgi:Tol biopolymer transport system component
MLMQADGSHLREPGSQLLVEDDVETAAGHGVSNSWTQFAGWSPDGTQAIVNRGWQHPQNAEWEEQQRKFRMEPGRWSLDASLVSLADGAVDRVTAVDRVSHYNSGLFFLPEKRGFGFTALIDGVSRPFVMQPDGRDKRDVSGGGTGFSYGYSASPDGSHISYNEDYQVYIANADGSSRQKIETGNPFNFAPQWSPDGQWLLFVSGQHGKANPWIVQADGTGLRQLADQGGYQGWVLFLDVLDFHQGSSDLPVWSVDGSVVYCSRQCEDRVELFEVTLSGEAKQLTSSESGTLHYHPTPSPDGRWLLYGSKRGGVRNLFVRNLQDGSERQVTTFSVGTAAMWPHWQKSVK